MEMCTHKHLNIQLHKQKSESALESNMHGHGLSVGSGRTLIPSSKNGHLYLDLLSCGDGSMDT